MVKIRAKFLFIFITVLALAMSTAYATTTKLKFSDIDVEVGGKTDKNLDDGDTISDEAEPGDIVEFKVEVMNNFTSSEDLDIEDITVQVTIEEIDDDDDMDGESDEFDLRAGRDKRVSIEFTVPEDVKEDDYNVIITAEGEDENGTEHSIEMSLVLEVNKENHLIRITRNSLIPESVSCNRKNVQMSVSLLNSGSEDEDDVEIRITNADLGVDMQEDVGDLEAEADDESRFSNTYTFSVPQDTEAGNYPILTRVLFNNGREREEKTATLTVNDCATKPPVTQPKPDTGNEDGEVVVIQPKPDTKQPTTPSGQSNLPPNTTITRESVFRSNGFILGVIIAEVVIVVAGIILVVGLFRRRG